jgi:hypothetical protein
MLKNDIHLNLLVILFSFGVYTLSFAEVSPEIQLGARGIVSVNFDHSPEDDSQTVSDFSDTSLLLGFRQKLYSDYRGQFVIGFQLPDRGSDLEPLFLHQMFFKIENRSNIFKIGRSRLRSALIEFPTFRDDDALYFTDILNPFSSGQNSEDTQYGDVLEASHIFGQRYWVKLYSGHVTEEAESSGNTEEDFGFNTLGLLLEYRVPETQRWNREVLNQIGVGFNSFSTDRPGYSGEYDKALKHIVFSTILNVYPDPVHFWDVRHQTIYNLGFSEIKQITDYATMTRAESISTFTSLRYLYRRLEFPTFQASLSYGYKNSPDLADNTDQHQIIANGLYRIGDNFDVGLQFQYQKNRGDVRELLGDHETRIQFAIMYSVEQLWNKQFDDRDSLLNLEHGYIP